MITEHSPSSVPTHGAATPRRPELIVCLDGSDRASDSIRTARELARWHGAKISAVALVGEQAETKPQIEQHLRDNDLEAAIADPVGTRSEMVDYLVAAAKRGATPAISAFGKWPNPSRLHGVLGDLVRANVERVLAIGPRVSESFWTSDGPIIESVDTVCRIEPLIEATEHFADSRTPKIIIANVLSDPDSSAPYSTNRIAAKFASHFETRVETVTIEGGSVSRTIGELAQTERASMILARSWHRSIGKRPNSASTSLALAADAPCPVLIVN